MTTTLRIRHPYGEDTTYKIPQGSSVTIMANGDVEILIAPQELQKTGAVSAYSIIAATTGHGSPPAIGSYIDVFTNIHEPDPTDPEVRLLVNCARVINTQDPNPATTKNRKVEIELELCASEIEQIQINEFRNSFTFRPVKPPINRD